MSGRWTDFLDTAPEEDRLLPWKAVQKDTGLSRTTAWRLQKDGEFPPSVVLSPGRVGYRQREIEAWKRSRVPRRDLAFAPQPIRAAARRSPVVPAQVAPEPSCVSAEPSPPPRVHSAPRGRARIVSADQLALDF